MHKKCIKNKSNNNNNDFNILTDQRQDNGNSLLVYYRAISL